MASGGQTFTLVQVLQLGDDMELPEDILIAEICLDDKRDMHFIHMYDSVVDNFVFKFVKRKGTEDVSSISLTTEIVKRILFLYPRFVSLVERYKGRDMPEQGIKYEVGTDVFVTIGKFETLFIINFLSYGSFIMP